jgi:hypothetical protein
MAGVMTYLPRRRNGFLGVITSKPVVLWALLIMMFLAIWQFLADSGQHPVHPSPRGEPKPFDAWASVATVGVGVLVFVGWLGWMRRRVRLFNKEASEALKLFAGADYTGAAASFGRMVERYRLANLRMTAKFNLAVSLVRCGELGRALEMFTKLDKELRAGNGGLRPVIAAQLAVVYALRGEPAAADRWIAEAEARRAAAGFRNVDGNVALARLVNDVRRDEPAAAVGAVDAVWTELEGAVVAAEMRPLRAVRAFAETCIRPGATPAAPLGEARPGELAWLGVEWPEMRTFLDARPAR